MEIMHSGVGNLGADPISKTVKVGDEERQVIELRVFFERSRKTDNGYDDDGGFWCDVSIWQPGLGKRAMSLLQKGSRVFVRGEVKASSYRREGEDSDRLSYSITADYFAIDTIGLASVTRQQRDKQEVAA